MSISLDGFSPWGYFNFNLQEGHLDPELVKDVNETLVNIYSSLYVFNGLLTTAFFLVIIPLFVGLLYTDITGEFSPPLFVSGLLLAGIVAVHGVYGYYLMLIIISFYRRLYSVRRKVRTGSEPHRYIFEDNDFNEVYGVWRYNSARILRIIVSTMVLVLWTFILWAIISFDLGQTVTDPIQGWLSADPAPGFLSLVLGPFGGIVDYLDAEQLILLLGIAPYILASFVLLGGVRKVWERYRTKRLLGEAESLRDEVTGFFGLSLHLTKIFIFGERRNISKAFAFQLIYAISFGGSGFGLLTAIWLGL